MPLEPEIKTDEVKVTVLGESSESYLLQRGYRKDNFPRSQVSFVRRNIKTGEAVAEIPVWLLDMLGWIDHRRF